MSVTTSASVTGGTAVYSTSTRDDMWKSIPHRGITSLVDGYGDDIDFHRFSEDEWTATVVSVGTGTSTVALTDRKGGWLRINCAANENDGGQFQSDAETILLTTTNKVWFDARVDLTEEVTQCDAICGLSILDSTIIAGAPTDGIYWRKDDGDTNWDFTTIAGSSATDGTALATAVVDTPIILGFTWNGTNLTPYANGVAQTALTTTVPTSVELAISGGYLNGAGSAQNDGMDFDWFRYMVIESRA